MSVIYADLHIHSILSPCADRNMTPQNIYPRIVEKGINVFAICDHNSTKNVRAFYEFGQKWFPQILFLPGIEIETKEELHFLGIFPDLENAEKVGEIIRGGLKEEIKRAEFMEPQCIINSDGEIIGEETKSLYLSAEIDLEDAVVLLRRHNAVVIASHIDRPSYSITSQLGIIPDSLFDVLEISPISVRRVIEKKEFVLRNMVYPLPESIPIITSTDAHSIDEIGHVRTGIPINKLNFEGLKEGMKENTMLEVIGFD